MTAPESRAVSEGVPSEWASQPACVNDLRARERLLTDLQQFGEPQDPAVDIHDIVAALFGIIDELRAAARSEPVREAGAHEPKDEWVMNPRYAVWLIERKGEWGAEWLKATIGREEWTSEAHTALRFDTEGEAHATINAVRAAAHGALGGAFPTGHIFLSRPPGYAEPARDAGAAPVGATSPEGPAGASDEVKALRIAAAKVIYRVGEWSQDLQRQALGEEDLGTDCGEALRELCRVAGVYRDEQGYPAVRLDASASVGEGSRPEPGADAIREYQRVVEAVALDGYRAWDRDDDSRVGKILGALAGTTGYRLDLDTARDALAGSSSREEAPSEVDRARLAALTEVHEFYEFDATSEEQFDEWLHERIKDVRVRLGLSAGAASPSAPSASREGASGGICGAPHPTLRGVGCAMPRGHSRNHIGFGESWPPSAPSVSASPVNREK